MTTEKSLVVAKDCGSLDDSRSAPPVKRYDFGQNNKQGYSVPDIIEKADGRFVLYDEVLPLLRIIQLQEALLAKQAAEMEAIGAGGVSGQPITRSPNAEAHEAARPSFVWNAAIDKAIDMVAMHAGSVELEAAIRTLKTGDT